MLAGGSPLAWVGVQTARDSRHVDLEATPSSRRLVAIVALVAISTGIGMAVATNLRDVTHSAGDGYRDCLERAPASG